DFWLDLAAGICLVVGAALSLAAGVGLLRFPDPLARLHAGTKPQVFGLMLGVVAIALATREWPVVLTLPPVVVLQLLTQPLAGHMVARASYRTKNYRPEILVVDELAPEAERVAGMEDS